MDPGMNVSSIDVCVASANRATSSKENWATIMPPKHLPVLFCYGWLDTDIAVDG